GTPTERAFADLWAEILSLEQAGVDDDFFVLGGGFLHAGDLVFPGRPAGPPGTVAALLRDPTLPPLPGGGAAAPRAAGGQDAEADMPAALVAPFELCPPAAVPERADDAYPVSAAQQALVFQHMHNPGYEVYVIGLRLRGACHPVLVRRAIARLAARHGYL